MTVVPTKPIRKLFDAHFPAVTEACDALTRWSSGAGVAVDPDLAAWLAAGGIEVPTSERAAPSWLRPVSPDNRVDASDALATGVALPAWSASALSAWNTFAQRVELAQTTRRFAPLLDAFASMFRVAERDDYYLVAHAEPAGTLLLAGYEQRHDEPEIDQLLARGIEAFVGMRHLYDSVGWRGVTPPNLEPWRAWFRTLSERVRFAFPYDDLAPFVADSDLDFVPLSSEHRLRTLVRRSVWIAALLRDGHFAADEHWELQRKRRDDPTPANAWRALAADAPAAMPACDALYWLWRAFFEQRTDVLDALLPALERHRADWVRDSVAVIVLARRGRQALGHIDDLAALARKSAGHLTTAVTART